MKYCKICYSIIKPDDYVEWIITQENYKYILEKYKWVKCDYCFLCITASKKLLWRLYINALLNSDCVSTILNLIERDIPVWLTDNLSLCGKPIKGLYYHNQMYSAKLETGLNDFQYYKLKLLINKIYEKNKNIKNLQYLLANLNL
jgi:hypothetical protein